MRYQEIINRTKLTDGRRWQDTDDVKLLNSQIKSLDNELAVNVYGPEVKITDAVKCIAAKPECKWFFDLLTTSLHKLAGGCIFDVDFHLLRFENEWLIWAIDQYQYPHIYDYSNEATFPFSAIALHAVNEAWNWHVSLIDVVEYEKE